MKLVVDTNILLSFFRENPVRSMIINSKSLRLELFTPEYAIEELRNNKLDLLKYSRLKTDKEIEFIITILKLFVDIKSMSFFEEFKLEAIKLSPDVKDSPFFALALKLNSSIWSNEPRLKRQSKIKVFSTQELKKEISK